jgi:hypothetical protein
MESVSYSDKKKNEKMPSREDCEESDRALRADGRESSESVFR